MPKTTPEELQSRHDRVVYLLSRSPDGLKESEIATSLHFEKRSVNNYLRELETKGRLYKDGVLWFYNYEYQVPKLSQLQLEPEQGMILYLACRLVVKHSDRRNLTAEHVLLMLAEALVAEGQITEDIQLAARELTSRPHVPGYEDIFRTVMRGYLYRRALDIVYRPYRGEPFRTTFHAYLIEPSGIGFSTYMIGLSGAANALRTYKIERIEAVSLLTRNAFTIPEDFPGIELLRNSWSIFYGEEIVRVVLRFYPEVAPRVRETYWHPSQSPIIDDPDADGCVLLSFEVADTTDLKPWIRTWGAQCEVLEPSELRDEMIGEARRMAELYGWHTHRHAPEVDDDDPLGLDVTFNDFFN